MNWYDKITLWGTCCLAMTMLSKKIRANGGLRRATRVWLDSLPWWAELALMVFAAELLIAAHDGSLTKFIKEMTAIIFHG